MLGHFPTGIIRNKADCLVSVTMGRAHTCVCAPSSVLAHTPQELRKAEWATEGQRNLFCNV